MSEFTKVATVGEIQPGEMKLVEADGREIVLANVNGEYFAFGGECTHRGGPLAEGILMDDVVECPWHGGQFNVRTGEVVSSPPENDIPTYVVKVEGESISVALG